MSTAGREAWLAARRSGIGGSDAAAIVACHPYHSLVSLWADKTGRLEPQADSARLRWGRRMEGAILDEYEDATGHRVIDGHEHAPELVEDFGDNVRMLRHRELDVMLGNLDGVVVDHPAGAGVIDAKTVMPAKFRRWVTDGRPPLCYLVQLAHYLEITGLDWACIAAFTGLADELYIFEMERDSDFGERLMEAEHTFWSRYVARDQEPPADGSRATAIALRELYPRDNGKAIRLTGPAVEWACEYDDLSAELRSISKRRDAVKTKLIATIGEAAAGILPDGSGYTYNTGQRGRTLRRASAKALRKYDP